MNSFLLACGYAVQGEGEKCVGLYWYFCRNDTQYGALSLWWLSCFSSKAERDSNSI